ncbi:SDR family NAD(P)-dependent oxidoreductase [Amycolatopsis benzoatilytica]|uniref:SDR family NAD(P)-dependent oxidoreductase n=1 Tax=Amycolatopsis benzoatilytica TaxID=346045 RepID=UPI00036692DD|nr:SDR family NAD(P)-dependent oxidoreductase [Amycolatopsis benzoatilytica]
MTTTLISGANKGLGYETARRLIAAGHTVYLGSRDAAKGQRAAEELGARTVQLDITDDSSVAAAVKIIEAGGGLDVLVNNAGIATELLDSGEVIGAEAVTADVLRETFETNTFGAVRMMHAFLPLLQRSATPVVVNVSSALGSLSRMTDPASHQYGYAGIAYPASKAALNMVTVQFAKAFPRIRINAVEPGYTQTDINHRSGGQSVEQGAEVIVRMAQIGADGPTGTYVDLAGPLPW